MAGRHRFALPDRRQNESGLRADRAQKVNRQPYSQHCAECHSDQFDFAGWDIDDLWRPAVVDVDFYRVTRICFCPRHAARGTYHRAQGVPAHTRSVAAFSSEPANRRYDARYRTGHPCRFLAGVVCAVQHFPDSAGNHHGADLSGAALRYLVFGDHILRTGFVYRLHDLSHGMAHPFQTHHE